MFNILICTSTNPTLTPLIVTSPLARAALSAGRPISRTDTRLVILRQMGRKREMRGWKSSGVICINKNRLCSKTCGVGEIVTKVGAKK